MANREEHTNVLVAQSLNWLLGEGVVRAEQSGRRDRQLPDIELCYSDGTRGVVEAKYAGGGARAAAEAAALGRFSLENPPHFVGAVVYSAPYRRDSEAALRADASLAFAFVGREEAAGEVGVVWRWREGTVYDLAQVLRQPRAIVGDGVDEVALAARRIEEALDVFVDGFRFKPAFVEAVGRVLQIRFDEGDGEKRALQRREALRVCGLILIGAFLFQYALAGANPAVKSPDESDLPGELENNWRFIVEEVNYSAVFGVALELALACSVRQEGIRCLRQAAKGIVEIALGGADVMGRVYHKLLADAKTLAAYYTSVPAAALVGGIALSPALNSHVDWGDMEAVAGLRVVDPACGSGTLLAAACWQLRDNYARAQCRKLRALHGGAGSLAGELGVLHKRLLEGGVWGYDILENAVHLTAITLGLMSPSVDFRQTRLYRAIIGKTAAGDAAGSLEMFERRRPLFNRAEQIEEKGSGGVGSESHLPSVDFCLMNPPYVRGQRDGEMLSFLGAEREAVHARVRRLGLAHGFSTDKGLGPAFVALACQGLDKEPFVKSGGRLAVILPASAAVGMGHAWRGAREGLMRKYALEFVIVSRESGRANFSDSTNLQECIVIGRKRGEGEGDVGGSGGELACFVALHKNPANNDAALHAARAICAARLGGESFGELAGNGRGKLGEFALLPYRGRSAWRGLAFGNLRLAYAAERFIESGSLQPFVGGAAVPTKKLGEMAVFGKSTVHHISNKSDNKRVDIVGRRSPYPVYYPSRYKAQTGAGQKDMRYLSESPSLFAMPLPGQEEWMAKHFASAGRLLLAESIRFNSFARVAVLMTEPVWASHFHPIRLRDGSEDKLKALTLWLNSTPSILLMAYFCLSTEEAKVSLGVGAAAELPVPDWDALGRGRLRKLGRVFDRLGQGVGLAPIARMETDAVRAEIDAALGSVLGWGDVAPLRAALAGESIINSGQV